MAAGEDYRDTLYTIDSRGRRKWVYAHLVPGRFFRRRATVAYVLMAFYLLMPWIVINGRQGIRLDIPHRRFTFFGAEFWATDTFFLFLLLFSLGMALFLFTAAFGRVWCGWACPETVFLEFLFRPIERLVEGAESDRRKLDRSPWSFRKVRIKLLKHGLCALCAWVIASTALAYFIGREPLIRMMSHSPLENPEMFLLTVALMLVMAFQFGWFREQFCTVLCPYARFQSVLMDPHSFLVGYDARRGEPRGKLRTKSTKDGDCIDCRLCVRVCPTGIDIRNGTQLECIACTACIDACDSVMDQVGLPKGLIRYDTEARMADAGVNWIRPRLFVYAGLLLLSLVTLGTMLSQRSPLDLEIIREGRASPFVIDASGILTNQFSMRLENKSDAAQQFLDFAVTPEGVTAVSPLVQMELAPEKSAQVPVFFRAPALLFHEGTLEVQLTVRTRNGLIFTRSVTLIGPTHQ